jgi:hypothetical protein
MTEGRVGNGIFAVAHASFPLEGACNPPTSLPNPPRILSDVPHPKRDPEEALVKAL